jgi:hypothetical protein
MTQIPNFDPSRLGPAPGASGTPSAVRPAAGGPSFNDHLERAGRPADQSPREETRPVAATRSDYGEREMWKLGARNEIARLAEHVANTQGPVVADEFMALIPLAGRKLVFQPFAFSELARSKAWDETPVLEALRRGEFELLLLYQAPDWPTIQTRWTPAMIAAIQEYYYTEEEIVHTLVARPGLKTKRSSAP